MTTQIKRRRGTTTEHSSFTGAEGELTVDTTKDTVVVHDGSTAGGHPLAKESGGTFTTVDINSGNIDNTIIGATTQAAISGTTGQFNTSLNVDGTVAADKVDIGNGVAGGTSEILFSDNVSSRGKIIYDHSSSPETLVLQTTGTTALSIDNSQNISIPNGNVDVTGTVTADGLTVDGVSTLNNHVKIANGYSLGWGDITTRITGNSSTDLIQHYTAGVQRMRIAANGDISFYEDTGTTAKLFWDAADERLGIGTTAPALDLHVVGADGVGEGVPSFNADSVAVFQNSGSAGDAAIVHIISGTTGNAFIAFGDKDDSIRQTITANQSDGDLKFATGNAALAMTITSGGNTCLGTITAPMQDFGEGRTTLSLKGTGSTDYSVIQMGNNGTSGNNQLHGQIAFYDVHSGSDLRVSAISSYREISTNSSYLSFGTSPGSAGLTEAMRIDRAGSLLIGGTDTDPSNNASGAGSIAIGGAGYIAIARSNGACALFNRIGSGGTEDGDVISIKRNGTAVGSIGAGSGGILSISTPSDYLTFRTDSDGDNEEVVWDSGQAGGTWRPGATNSSDLGYADRRWRNLFIGNDIGHLDNGGNARLLYDKSANLLGNTGTNVTGATVTSSGQIKVTGSNASTVALSVGDVGTGFFNTGSNSIGLSTGGSEKLRMESAGHLAIGRTSTSATTDHGFTLYGTGQMYIYSSGTGNSDVIRSHDANGTHTSSIDADGDYVDLSDERKKENIADIDAGLAEVMQLQPRKFDWIASGEHVASGFIAQEVQEVFPSAVVENDDGFLMMKNKQLIPLLTKALQEAVARIETLEAAVTALQGE